jgi:NAD(P)-dependent dehydrogenase (short-subunit alcohol dehydrogenase family)
MTAIHPSTTAPTPGLPALGAVTDRVALVTGGTRGIGAAISRRLIAAGAHIAAGHWSKTGQAEIFAKEFETEYIGGGQGIAAVFEGM